MKGFFSILFTIFATFLVLAAAAPTPEARGGCGRPGGSCWKRDVEHVAIPEDLDEPLVKREASPLPGGGCRRPGGSCWKSKRAVEVSFEELEKREASPEPRGGCRRAGGFCWKVKRAIEAAHEDEE